MIGIDAARNGSWLCARFASAAGSWTLGPAGFAALAAARAVGSEGHVRGVDISAGMLAQARAALTEADLANVELVQGDATALPQYGSETFDVITCAAGLLYMPVADTRALREWHRLLKVGGLVAFSTMASGSPPGARIFRACAATFGVSLPDPSASLGSVSACRNVLERAAFEVVTIVSGAIEFSAQDLTCLGVERPISGAFADSVSQRGGTRNVEEPISGCSCPRRE